MSTRKVSAGFERLDSTDPGLMSAWNDLINPLTPTNYFICSVDYGQEEAVVKHLVSGKGGFAEMRHKLINHETKAFISVLSVMAQDRSGKVSSDRNRLIMLITVGPMVKPDLRNYFIKYAEQLEKMWIGIVVKLPIYDDDDLTRKNIAAALLSATGGHKPNHFIFGPNDSDSVANLTKPPEVDDDPLS
jgi:hypothetical protein